MLNSSDRLAAVAIGAILTYAAIEYAIEQRKKFAAWRDSFLEPFHRHPGRQAFLRDTLMREEMTVRERSTDG